MYRCIKCGKPLNPETTGCFPFAEGYICSVCYEKAAEDFCRAADEYENPTEIDADSIANEVKMLKMLE